MYSISAANITHHRCSFVCPSPVFDYNVYTILERWNWSCILLTLCVCVCFRKDHHSRTMPPGRFTDIYQEKMQNTAALCNKIRNKACNPLHRQQNNTFEALFWTLAIFSN